VFKRTICASFTYKIVECVNWQDKIRPKDKLSLYDGKVNQQITRLVWLWARLSISWINEQTLLVIMCVNDYQMEMCIQVTVLCNMSMSELQTPVYSVASRACVWLLEIPPAEHTRPERMRAKTRLLFYYHQRSRINSVLGTPP